jgi:hypothetical protein
MKLDTNQATVTLNVTYGSGTAITLTGQLTGIPNVANQSITISGQANGAAITNAKGKFLITLVASGLGNVYAAMSNGSSNTAMVTLTDTAPVITSFQATEGQNGVWTFSGTVTWNRSFTSMTVNLGGQLVSLQNVSTTANGTGTFSVNVTLDGQPDDNGLATAVAVDPWGLQSNTATATVQQ